MGNITKDFLINKYAIIHNELLELNEKLTHKKSMLDNIYNFNIDLFQIVEINDSIIELGNLIESKVTELDELRNLEKKIYENN